MANMDTVDVSTEPEASLEERLRAVCGHLNVLNAQLVALAAEALEKGTWEGMGIRSLSHWLCWQAGISPSHAGEVIRLAEARVSHPLVMGTFAEGLLSVDQAAVMKYSSTSVQVSPSSVYSLRQRAWFWSSRIQVRRIRAGLSPTDS